MDSLIRDSMVAYMLENGLFEDQQHGYVPDQQHGYVPNRSCITQILCVMENSTECLDSCKCIYTILSGFSKSF